jgi:phosphoglycolate phosphatase
VKYKNILFDLDGTLIDSAPGIEESFFYAYKQIYKIDCPKNIRKLIGPPIDQVLVLINGEKNSSIINKFVEEFKCHYDNAGYKNSLLFDGVLNILEILSLNKNVKTFLVTNKRYKPTKLLLKYFLIEKYFCEICCPDSLEVKFTNKTDLVGNLLIRQGLRQNETILIGDTNHDSIAASLNELDFAFVDYGYGVCDNYQYLLTEINRLMNVL